MNLNVSRILLVLLTMLVLTGCGTEPLAQQTATALPPYLHYIAPKEFNLQIEFDYPSSWFFYEDVDEYSGRILLRDSPAHTLSTPQDSMDSEISGTGSILILIQRRIPSQTPDTELDPVKESYNHNWWITVLDDYKIKIDGQDARILEYLTNDLRLNTTSPTPPPPLTFRRVIVFAFKERIYTILFSVSEGDRGGEFEKGYEYFFNSLKIVP